VSKKTPEVEILARGVCVMDGQLLVCHTKGADNTYLPGGHVDFGETVKDALVREIKEELGLKSSVGRFLGACDHSFLQKGKRHCEVNLVFELEVEGVEPGVQPKSQEDYIEFLWEDISAPAESALEPAMLRGLLGTWIADTGTIDHWASSVL